MKLVEALARLMPGLIAIAAIVAIATRPDARPQDIGFIALMALIIGSWQHIQ
jgi:hypothetical protein